MTWMFKVTSHGLGQEPMYPGDGVNLAAPTRAFSPTKHTGPNWSSTTVAAAQLVWQGVEKISVDGCPHGGRGLAPGLRGKRTRFGLREAVSVAAGSHGSRVGGRAFELAGAGETHRVVHVHNQKWWTARPCLSLLLLVAPCCSLIDLAHATAAASIAIDVDIEAGQRSILLPRYIVGGATLRQTNLTAGFVERGAPQKTEASELARLSAQIWGIHIAPTSQHSRQACFLCAAL